MAQSGKEGVGSETFTVLGHRGAKGHAPENTLPSFHKAIELGATIVTADRAWDELKLPVEIVLVR